MNRRFFMKSAVATMAALSGLGAAALAAPSQFAKAFRSPPDTGFPRRPMKLIAGQAPAGFAGTYFLNGPAKHDRGGIRYDHWFDGDGMIHAFRFGEVGATHEGRFVETPKFKAEQAAERLLFPGFDTVPPDPAPVTKSDDINVANISVIPVGEQLWALWEGGSATGIKPGDLSTEGFITLGDGLEGVPFSAHPRIDPQGRI
ncbi:MAG: carotenoid oxygenase family protein, partial [Pseudomonadota bacterium]